jgi:hypothetical protein
MILISACASAKSVADENFYMESPSAAPMEQAAGMDFAMEESMRDSIEYEEMTTDSGVNSAAVDRIVIRNADMSIVVDDPADAMTAIGRMAERMGGFIVTSNMWKARNYNDVEVPEGNITIRVPAELLNQALDEIKALTNNTTQDVLTENISGQDVTEQYTNLNARLRNLEDAEEQLRTILDNATDTEAVLEVFNRLTEIREEIEVIKGQIKYYEESAALSAISVRIQAHEAVNPISVAGWKPSVTVSRALQSLVNAFQAIVDGLIWVVLYILPILLVLALPVVVFFLIIRGLVRRNRRKKAKDQNVDVEK